MNMLRSRHNPVMAALLASVALPCLAVSPVTAQGESAPCVSLNVRPQTISGNGLQQVLEAVSVPASTAPNAADDQSTSALFQAKDGRLVFTYIPSDFAVDSVGIYEATDPSNEVVVFTPANAIGGTQVVVDILPNGDVKVDGVLAASNFENCFGFYLDEQAGTSFCPSPRQWKLYSEDLRNQLGVPQALVYEGNNQTFFQIGGLPGTLFASDQLVVAWENLPNWETCSDRDYNESVFRVEGVKGTCTNCSSLAVSGSGAPGATLTFDLLGADPNSPAVLAISVGEGTTTWRFGVLGMLTLDLVQPIVPVRMGITDANGDVSLDIRIPNGNLPLTGLFGQGFTVVFTPPMMGPPSRAFCTSNVKMFQIGGPRT